MPLANHQDLTNAIADWLNRTDLATAIPNFIALAEADIRTDMRSRGITFNAAINLNSAAITLPTDIKAVRSLYDEWGPIRMVAPEEMIQMRKRFPSGGVRADVASIFSSSPTDVTALKLYVAPVPSPAMMATIIYEPELPALTTSAPTNWLMTMHPNVYLYGSLKHSAPFLRDDERVPIWDKLYMDAMQKLKLLRDDIEFGAGPLVAMPRSAY